jgi:hypothetical protein
LAIKSQDIAATTARYELRNTFPVPNSVFAGIRFVFFAQKILIHTAKEGDDQVINPIEKVLNATPSSEFAFRSALYAIYRAEYCK